MIVIKITIQVGGMVCGMCEAHVNDAVRRALPVKKVSSRRAKKETVILAEQDIEDSLIEAVVKESGYEFLGITREESKPRGLSRLFRR